MYQGRFDHNLDEKGRVAIPKGFRKILDGSPEASVVVTVADQCLSAFSKEAWAEKVEKIQALNQIDPNVISFKRIFIGCAHECPIDKAGRILLPPDLRAHAMIQRSCVFVGQIDKFEIWSDSLWQNNFAGLSDQMGSILGQLSSQGVSL